MPIVWIPSLMRDLTDGREKVVVEGNTLRQVVHNFDRAFPGIGERICDGEILRPTVAVAVDGETTPLGLMQPVEEGSEIHFVPAISGG